jgi:DNA-binding MarR family transcriptional regulator
MRETYFKSVVMVERLHRLFLEVVGVELERMQIRDINSVQCLLLYHIGREQVTVGELTGRGYYLGSNVNYNLSKTLKNQYLVHERSDHDRRIRNVRLSEKGLALYAKIDELLKKHEKELERNGIDSNQLNNLVSLFNSLESFWKSLLAVEVHRKPDL